MSGEGEGARLPKSIRLRRRPEFLAVQSRGKKVSTDLLVALVLLNGRPETRVGFTVSSKLGNAVVRNRVRRRLRELFRTRRQDIPRGLDVVLVAKAAAAQADWRALSASFDALSAKLKRQFS